MRLLIVVATLLLGALVAAEPLSFFRRSFFGGQRVLDESLRVPGESPFEFCASDHKDDLIVIERINLTPNPPQAGQSLLIEAKAKVLVDIEEGAYVMLQIKYGLVTLIKMKADLCEQIKNVDMQCPIEKGLAVIQKEVDLPEQIPPGTYTVTADVYTRDDNHVTCLTATVTFPVS